MIHALLAKYRFLFPQLREEVVIEKQARKNKGAPVFALRLPDGQQLKISEETHAALLLMSGFRHLEELRQALTGQEIALSAEDLIVILDEMVRFGAVDLNRSALLPQPGFPSEYRFLNGTRVSHRLAVQRCRRATVGPLSMGYAETITAHAMIRDHERLKHAALFLPLKGADNQVVIERNDGGCIFLDGERCLLEDRLGRVAMPVPCRHFPFSAWEMGGEVYYGVSAMDESTLDARQSGDPVTVKPPPDYVLVDLFDMRPRRHRRREVLLDSGYRLPNEVYLRLEEKILREITANPQMPPVEFLQQLITAVAWLPSVSRQVVNVIEAVHDLKFNELRLAGPFWEGFWYCFGPLLHRLAAEIRRRLDGEAQQAEFEPRGLARDDLLALSESLDELRSLWESGDPEALPKLTVEPEVNGYFLYYFSQFLFAKGFLSYPNLASALLVWLLGYFVSRLGSDRITADGGRTFRTMADFATAMARWQLLVEDTTLRDLLTPKDDIERFLDQL